MSVKRKRMRARVGLYRPWKRKENVCVDGQAHVDYAVIAQWGFTLLMTIPLIS